MSSQPASPSRTETLSDLLPAETTSPDATRKLGEKLAACLRPGDIVALYGDLGAGKTHLAKGVGAALGIDARSITSPTFTILHEHAHLDVPLYHFDAYRIQDPDEFHELGYEDYFYGRGVCLVEWPAHVEPLLPAHTIRLCLSHLGRDRRRIEFVEGDAG